MQTLTIKGTYVEITIKSQYSKDFKEAELILMASQMLKAHTTNNLKDLLLKLKAI